MLCLPAGLGPVSHCGSSLEMELTLRSRSGRSMYMIIVIVDDVLS